ncbi:RING-H2 finger protein ATL54-like [Actinidia eriantha]|uniref:RING-H2 finger protein ATL54-like n=1 Tax=Actinidia eriantha TaxID=165200 RepID=UPI00258F2271|nr:RING-H2 finger protein ATL54-like [Actinidia eriantha]
MAFSHRKLMADSGDISASICAAFCNPYENKDGYCPILCIYRCYPTCNRTLTSLIPPLDSPTTTLSDHPNKPQKIHLSLILSLSLLATICLLFSLYAAYKYYKNWQASRTRSTRQIQEQEETHEDFIDEDHGPTLDHPIWYIRTIGLQPSIIEKITVLRYKRGEGLVEGTECSVCLSEFQEDETLRLLPKCSHAFHIPCIDTWLRSHTNCPMCRAGIVVAGSAPPEDQSGDGDSPVSEESAQVVIPEGEIEYGNYELRVGITEEKESPSENGGNSAEPCKKDEVGEAQPMRRSASMDCLSASVIIADIANSHSGEFEGNSISHLGKVESKLGIVAKKVDDNQSLFLMKRSFSCSGKVLLSRYNPSRNSILPC